MEEKNKYPGSLVFSMIIFCFILAGCTNKRAGLNSDRNMLDEKSLEDSLYETPPSYTLSPFDIAELPDVTLPDSLGGRTVSGQMVLQVALDSTGSVVATEIVRLRLSDSNNVMLIEFYNIAPSPETKYPLEVKKYLEWAISLSKRILFKRDQSIDAADRNLIYVRVRID
jgi:hypothetical protein